jgi:carboxyl-terminal processing protease
MLSEIAIQLFTQSMYFDFATRYRNSHDVIDSPENFSISDEDYELFKAFIEEKKFEFQTASEMAFAELMSTAKKEKYYDLAEEEFNSLEEKLIHNNLKDLETFEKEIRQILKEEIVNRYYYQAGRILAQIQDDVQLDKAKEVLNTPATIQEVLAGKQGALARAVVDDPQY